MKRINNYIQEKLYIGKGYKKLFSQQDFFDYLISKGCDIDDSPENHNDYKYIVKHTRKGDARMWIFFRKGKDGECFGIFNEYWTNLMAIIIASNTGAPTTYRDIDMETTTIYPNKKAFLYTKENADKLLEIFDDYETDK